VAEHRDHVRMGQGGLDDEPDPGTCQQCQQHHKNRDCRQQFKLL
jgi:hypothetical protein